MIYIRKHKVIFLHLTKTGGESVLEALNAPGKRHAPVSVILDKKFREDYKNQLNPYRDEYINNIKANWNSLRITFVRNPWARLVSEYHYNIARGKEVDNFTSVINRLLTCTDDVWKWSQTRWLSHNGKFYADRVYKLEYDRRKFEDDFNVQLPHKNKSRHKPYREYYNNRTKKIVELVFADDIKTFGYKF